MRTTALAVTLRRLRAAFSLGMGRSQPRSGMLLLFGLGLAFVAGTEDAAAQYRPGFKKYDQERRLVAAADERGELWSFVYEPDGSRQVWFGGRQLALEKADGTVEAYAYDTRGQKILTRITGKGTAPRYINHTPLPESSRRLPARPYEKVLATAQAARMNAAASVYVRDGLGRLTSVTTADGTTRYRYFEDVDTPLIAEVIHSDGSRDRFDLQTAQAAHDALAVPSAATRVAPPSSDLSGLCSTSGNRFAFGGYRYECELGLYLTPSGRMYDPAIGRFTSQDSYLGRFDEPPSLHRYLYANANPVRYVDPTGHQSADLANEYRIYREEQAAERRREELRRPITSATVTTSASYRFDGDSEKYYLDYVTRNGTEAQRRQAFVHGLGSYSAAYGQRTGKVAATGVAIGVTAGLGAGPLGLGAVATDTLSGSAGGFVSAKFDNAPAEEVVERTVIGGALGGLLGAGTRVGSRWMGGEAVTILESQTQLTTAEREALRAGTRLEPPTAPGSGAAPTDKRLVYSTAFEMRLDPADVGTSRAVHFNRANAALDRAMQTDPEFAGMMDRLIPGVADHVSQSGGRQVPPEWIWEHASTSTAQGEAGVMRLVPKAQHSPGSDWWRVLHPDPGARGGYSEWAIPAGAKPNKPDKP